MVCTQNLDDVQKFNETEDEVDYLNKEIVKFLVKLTMAELDEKDRQYVISAINTMTDLERVGDYAENFMEAAVELKEDGVEFSEAAKEEIRHMHALVETMFNVTMGMYKDEDLSKLPTINQLEDQVDLVTGDMVKNHVKRLTEGVCSFEAGSTFISLVTNAERVGDHVHNVACSVAEFA